MSKEVGTGFGSLSSTAYSIFCTLLISIAPFSVSAKSLCDKKDLLTAVRGDGLCLAITTFNADPERKYHPRLVVMLHGDISKGGRAAYHIPKMLEVAEDERTVSVAMIRPGYVDDKRRKSEGSNYRRTDSYTKKNITAVAEAIEQLKVVHRAEKIVLVGHSGGAAMAGVIIGMFPGLVDKAVLISCPCNIAKWRKMKGRRAWKRSLSPSSFVNKVPSSTEVVAIVGKNDRNTRPRLSAEYVASLKKRNISAKMITVEASALDLRRNLWQVVHWEIK